MRILVTGATGFVASNLIPALVAEGHDVLAGVHHLDTYEGPGFPTPLDVDDPETVARALVGCDAAYYLVHSMAEGDGYAEIEREAATVFGRTAKSIDCKVIYLGGLGHDDDPELSDHLRSRHQVGAILRGTADTVELRASLVLGAGSTSFEILRDLVTRLPVLVAPKWVETKSQPIALDDAIRYLVAALTLEPGCYEIGGPDVLTYREMLERYAQLIGKKRKVVPVPVLTPGLSSRWLRLVTDQDQATGRALIDSLACEVVVEDHRIEDLVPGDLMGFDEAVRAAELEEDDARELLPA